MKTAIYVDGFNLYYAIRKLRDSKWLDINKLSHHLLPTENIEYIKYFTAIVKPRPDDLQQQQRQLTYIRALKTIKHLSVTRGFFLTYNRWLPNTNCIKYHIEKTEVVKTEEKGSDVNLASHLIVDGYKRLYDRAWVVSNDSDLLEPIKLVRKELRLFVGVVNPHHYRRRSRALRNVASGFVQIKPNHISSCQFPAQLTDANGTIRKPAGW